MKYLLFPYLKGKMQLEGEMQLLVYVFYRTQFPHVNINTQTSGVHHHHHHHVWIYDITVAGWHGVARGMPLREWTLTWSPVVFEYLCIFPFPQEPVPVTPCLVLEIDSLVVECMTIGSQGTLELDGGRIRWKEWYDVLLSAPIFWERPQEETNFVECVCLFLS